MDYINLEVKTFEDLGYNNGLVRNVSIYFVRTDDYILTSIPEWNWSYMWDLVRATDKELKTGCVKALSILMGDSDAKKTTEQIYRFLILRN